MQFLRILPVILFVSLTAFSQPKGDSPKGGIFVTSLGVEPSTLHPLEWTDIYSLRLKNLVFDTLLDKDIETNEWVPRLAEKWEVSKDSKTITFYLRQGATFHDGTPVTADDVKFSFDILSDQRFEAIRNGSPSQGMDKVEVVNPTTVKFIAKEKFFKNIDTAATIYILPKHIYGNPEQSRKLGMKVIGSGPYAFERYDKGSKIVLHRFDKWSVTAEPYWKNAFNFEKIDFRFFKTDSQMIEKLKQGVLDYVSDDDMYPETFNKKATGSEWGRSVFKEKVFNRKPKDYLFIGWNLHHDLFRDKNVRLALANLMNREEMNKKFRFGESDLATGPVTVGSEYKSQNIKPIPFDPKAATDLLANAGWADSNKDGILDKVINGQKVDFRFTLIYATKDTERYWNYYRDELKKAGIEMNLKLMDWGSFSKALESKKFEACSLAWAGGDVDIDLKPIWHSSSAGPGGFNFVGYSNSDVDKLIDQARVTFDKKERIPLVQKIDELVAADMPYLFMFDNKYSYYAYSKRMDRPKDTYNYGIGSQFWSIKR